MSKILGTNVPAAIVPFTTEDTYPTHDAQYGKGGLRDIATLALRDAIPAARRSEGMVVYVMENKHYYQLLTSLTEWQDLGLVLGNTPEMLQRVDGLGSAVGDIVLSVLQMQTGIVQERDAVEARIDGVIEGRDSADLALGNALIQTQRQVALGDKASSDRMDDMQLQADISAVRMVTSLVQTQTKMLEQQQQIEAAEAASVENAAVMATAILRTQAAFVTANAFS